MKIYFEGIGARVLASTRDDLLASQCDDDDQCPPNPGPLSNRATDFWQSLEDIAWQSNCTFYQPSGLYIHTYTHEHILVCAPTGSGHIAVLDKDAAALLERLRSPTSLAELAYRVPEWSFTRLEKMLRLFYTLGFLATDDEPVLEAEREAESTLSAWIHVTNSCNLRCSYCYLTKTSEHMSDDTAKRAVDAVFRSARTHGFKRVMLRYAGGEASMRGDSVIAIHDYALQLARDYHIQLRGSLLSNGVFLSSSFVDDLRERQIGIGISLDGIGDNHDRQRAFVNGRTSFRLVDRTIARLLDAGFPPSIMVTVSGRNLSGLPALVEYILDRDLPFSCSYYRENDNSATFRDLRFEEEQIINAMRTTFSIIERRLPARSLLSSLLDKASLYAPHSHACSAGHNYLVIDQHGGVAKCHADITHTLTSIDADDPLQVVRDDHTSFQNVPVEEKEGCRNCVWRNWCSGGCPLHTYKATGRNDIKSPNCNIYQALFPDVLRLEALRLQRYVSPVII
jgi:uncharacterized protein